jgi:hypothetical protein
MTTTANALDEEIPFFEDQKPELLQDHEGEYVLIKENEVLGFFRDWEAAYAEGPQRFGFSEPMLIHRIQRDEPVRVLPIALWPVNGDV